MDTKTCTVCKEEKSLQLFPRDKIYRGGHRHECQECKRKRSRSYEKKPGWARKTERKPRPMTREVRDYVYRRKYGITHNDYDKMLVNQQFKCALCPRQPHQTAHRRLAVDHCHETGKVRGLLCMNCNRALARWGDNAAGISKVLCYLSD